MKPKQNRPDVVSKPRLRVRVGCLIIRISFLLLLIFITASQAGADSANDLLAKALKQDKEGFLNEAAKTWEQLLQTQAPENLKTLAALKLSSTYLKLAQPFKALEAVKGLAVSKPEHYDVQFHLGNAHGKLKNYPEATEAFKRAVELRSDEGLGYVGLALAYFGDKKPGIAIEHLQKAKVIFKKKKNISWYRDARIMVHQIKGFAIYPPNFSDLWLENNLELIRNTYEKVVFNLEDLQE